MNALLLKYNLEFAHPLLLCLLVLIPLGWWWYAKMQKARKPYLKITTVKGIQHLPKSWKQKISVSIPILYSIVFAMFVFIIAKLQHTNTFENVTSEGVDIVLSMDISGSMLAEDFQPNRMEAAKKTAIEFINQRPTDRFGLVVFAGESFTQCPITIDQQVLKQQIKAIDNGLLEDGTAIGMGLATAVDRLKETKGTSKVVILLTDGVNNSGKIDPQTALEIAKAYNVKVYTIGIGSEGEALMPVQTQLGISKTRMPVQIDEKLLTKIATETGGKYFRATDNSSLNAIYAEIDKLEKTEVESTTYKQSEDLFRYFAIIGMIALFLAVIMQATIYRSVY